MRRLIPSHLDICCLQKLIIIACGSESVNAMCNTDAPDLEDSQFKFPFLD